jgi:hypothetical protein
MEKETVEQAGKRLGFSKPDYVEFDGHQNEGFYFDIFKKGWDAAMEQQNMHSDDIQGRMDERVTGLWTDEDMIEFLNTYSSRGKQGSQIVLDIFKKQKNKS